MSDKIKEMIGNIMNKEHIAARENFDELLTAKMGDALDAERIRVSGTIYNGMSDEDFVTESVDEEEDLEDDDLEVDED